jgi:hypothetical protein
MGPSLAKSWKESPDGLSYEFKPRRGVAGTHIDTDVHEVLDIDGRCQRWS